MSLGKRVFKSAPVQRAVAWAAAHYVRFVAGTTRWHIVGAAQWEGFIQGPPCIVVFWHESLPSMPVFWLGAKRRGMRRPAMVLASRHRDGRLIGQAVQNLGIGVVAGSTSRGGAAGLRGLLRALADGAHVGLTPDGPRGPRRVAAPGVAQLAAISGAAVLPCAAFIRWGVKLDSWDAMRLPLPFGRGVLVCGEVVMVDRRDSAAATARIAAALHAACATAETPA